MSLKGVWQRITGQAAVNQQLSAVGDMLMALKQEQNTLHAALLQQFEAIKAQQLALTQGQQPEEISKELKRLEDVVKKEAANAALQIESFLNLQTLWSGRELPMPPMQGWPVSPDLALALAESLQVENYSHIIEFGSGSSTLLMARFQAMHANHVSITSFEHSAQFHERTGALLRRAGVQSLVNLRLAPLVAYEDRHGVQYKYYDCDGALQELAQKLEVSAASKILVFVDGPPAATGPLARYPALDVVLKHFPKTEIHVMLDDYMRNDEKQIAKVWQADLRSAGRTFTQIELPLEKGAILIKINASPASCEGMVTR